MPLRKSEFSNKAGADDVSDREYQTKFRHHYISKNSCCGVIIFLFRASSKKISRDLYRKCFHVGISLAYPRSPHKNMASIVLSM